MSSVALVSGGLDSAVLLAFEAAAGPVIPLYVRVGLSWERAELRMLQRLLQCDPYRTAAPLETLDFTMRDVYASSHWAIVGRPPAYDTPDEDVYLPGRNLVLLTKAGVVAAARRASRIVLGPLAGNPFPDATPDFFQSMARALTLGLAHEVAIAAPFLDAHKDDVIRRGQALNVPFELTLSCMQPSDDPLPRHCGQCSKCRERRDAFAIAGVADPAAYLQPGPR